MAVQFFDLKRTGFVLWRPLHRDRAPALVIGEFQAGNPPTLINRQQFDLAALPSHQHDRGFRTFYVCSWSIATGLERVADEAR